MGHVFVSPLNWGLGHSTRDISLIEELLHRGHEVTIGTSGNALVQTASHSLVEGLWTHVVAVKSSATLQLYLNGVLSVSGPISGTVRTEVLPDLRLGCGPAANALNGALDEFGLWQRALSAADVVRLYNNGTGLAYELF